MFAINGVPVVIVNALLGLQIAPGMLVPGFEARETGQFTVKRLFPLNAESSAARVMRASISGRCDETQVLQASVLPVKGQLHGFARLSKGDNSLRCDEGELKI
jgi:hypothetical protein